jgi:hypothetical protein
VLILEPWITVVCYCSLSLQLQAVPDVGFLDALASQCLTKLPATLNPLPTSGFQVFVLISLAHSLLLLLNFATAAAGGA